MDFSMVSPSFRVCAPLRRIIVLPEAAMMLLSLLLLLARSARNWCKKAHVKSGASQVIFTQLVSPSRSAFLT